MEGNILSQTSLDQMLDPIWWVEFGQGEGIGVGLGPFMTKKDDQIIKIGHGGVTLGGMTHVYYYPTKNAYISILTNTITADHPDMMEKWVGGFAPNPNGTSVIDQFENIVLEL